MYMLSDALSACVCSAAWLKMMEGLRREGQRVLTVARAHDVARRVAKEELGLADVGEEQVGHVYE